VTPRALGFIGSLASAAVVVGIGWTAVSRGRATLDERLIPQNLTLMAGHFDLSWLTTSILAMVSPLQPQFYESALVGPAATIVANLANIGLLALCVVAAVRSQPGSVIRALAIAVAGAALAFGPVLTVINYVSLGVQFGIPARYGLSLVPAMAAVAGTAVRSRYGRAAVVAVGLLFYVAITLRLLT
jgi:hypothetical protein